MSVTKTDPHAQARHARLIGTPGRARRSPASLLFLVAVPVAVIVVLRRIDGELAGPAQWSPDGVAGWVSSRDPITVAMAVLRMATLGVAYHLLAVTALAVVGSLAHAPVLARASDLLALPGTRGLLRRAVGATISASTLIPSLAGHAAPLPPSVVVLKVDPHEPGHAQPGSTGGPSATTSPGPAVTLRVEPGPDGDAMRGPMGGEATLIVVGPAAQDPVVDRSTPGTTIAAPPGSTAPSPPGSVPTAPSPESGSDGRVSDRWIVRRGDHIWSISERVLARAWGRSPTERETDAYWREVILANASVADPDVVVPGQAIVLPPVSGP